MGLVLYLRGEWAGGALWSWWLGCVVAAGMALVSVVVVLWALETVACVDAFAWVLTLLVVLEGYALVARRCAVAVVGGSSQIASLVVG